ncbi:hypothetical protein SAMN03084138_01632 [Enterovibrio norvegicus DSM 15893]|uniref:Uncharacterized protein n=1 Tax=Enterovibrio norvegicus DSM 15893 TaxID=1121869 RepID=A0A1I5NL33_9GAMM|nr:hypothetical protein SAMN03084138_01632 [Enterovibrio norvegicus DSM 15893]
MGSTTLPFFLLNMFSFFIQRYANQVAMIERMTEDVLALHQLRIVTSH